MNPFQYDPVTRLKLYEIDFGTHIYARPRTIVYYILRESVGCNKDSKENDYWAVEGNTYPVREQLSAIPEAVWHSEGKRWLIPYTEENRLVLEEIRKSQ